MLSPLPLPLSEPGTPAGACARLSHHSCYQTPLNGCTRPPTLDVGPEVGRSLVDWSCSFPPQFRSCLTLYRSNQLHRDRVAGQGDPISTYSTSLESPPACTSWRWYDMS